MTLLSLKENWVVEGEVKIFEAFIILEFITEQLIVGLETEVQALFDELKVYPETEFDHNAGKFINTYAFAGIVKPEEETSTVNAYSDSSETSEAEVVKEQVNMLENT